LPAEIEREFVARSGEIIYALGGAYMLDPSVQTTADELGISPWSFYYLGRAGVLGDVDADVVLAAAAWFEPNVLRKAWERGRAVVAPAAATRRYAALCQDWGRRHFGDFAEAGRLGELLQRIAVAASPVGAPLFAGWRALPLPPDMTGRLSQLLMVMRELRGARHLVAVLANELTPLEAQVAGPGYQRFFGWRPPFPEVTDTLRRRRDAAEELTTTLSVPDFEPLSGPERDELAQLLQAAHDAADLGGAG
jgi:hypothetical protein